MRQAYPGTASRSNAHSGLAPRPKSAQTQQHSRNVTQPQGHDYGNAQAESGSPAGLGSLVVLPPGMESTSAQKHRKILTPGDVGADSVTNPSTRLRRPASAPQSRAQSKRFHFAESAIFVEYAAAWCRVKILKIEVVVLVTCLCTMPQLLSIKSIPQVIPHIAPRSLHQVCIQSPVNG